MRSAMAKKQAPAPPKKRVSPRRASPRDRLVSAVDGLRAHEARLETIVGSARELLTVALADGSLAGGGFGAVADALAQMLPDRAFLGQLQGESFPESGAPGSFAAYVTLVTGLRALEAEAQREIERARVLFARLEEGGFELAGYRSYEEMLGRVLTNLPHLATASLLAESPPEPIAKLAPLPQQRNRRSHHRLSAIVAAAVLVITGITLAGRRVHAVPIAAALPVASATPP